MESNEIFGGATEVAKKTTKSAAKKTTAPKETAKKTTSKKTTTKAEPVKTAEEKVAEVKKTETVKAAAKSEGKTTKAAKKSVKLADVKKKVYVEYMGQQVDYDAIIKKIEAVCKKQKVTVKDVTLYIKPEDNACYYVVNKETEGRVDLF